MKAKRFFVLFSIVIFAFAVGCRAAEAPASSVDAPRITACEYLGYYLSGWKLEYDGGVIRADEPLGTGSEMVNAYITPHGEEERLLTSCMGVYTHAYLSGDWLYFSYADTDTGEYDTCRINLETLDEPEFLGVTLRFATDNYFYYCKDDDYESIYRRDANFENEALTFKNTYYSTGKYPGGDRIVFANEDNNGYTIVVYNQEGETLFSTEANISTSWDYHIYNRAFYWFDNTNTPIEPLRIHQIDLYTGEVTSFADTYIDIEGFPTSIADIDEQGVYVKINVPFLEEYDGPEPFPNTKLYRIPHTGGSADLVKEWYES